MFQCGLRLMCATWVVVEQATEIPADPSTKILSRIMGEDSFKSFRAVLNPRTIQSLLKRNSLSDANSFKLLFKSALDAVNMASENGLQQHYATS